PAVTGCRRIRGALDDNDPAGRVGDGEVYAPGQPVEWFGRETQFPAGPGALAQRTGALVLPGACERTSPGRFRIVIEPAIDPASFPTTAALHQAIAGAAERQIRAHLDQWCIFRPLWSAPAADAAPAPGLPEAGHGRGADA